MSSLFVRWLRFQLAEISRKEELKLKANNIAKVLNVPQNSKSYQRILDDLENGVIQENDILYKN